MTALRQSAPGIRSLPLPIEHLDAELLAAPLVNLAAFAAALTGLDPKLGDQTAVLWRQTECDLLARFPGMSVDELVIRRDRTWLSAPHLSRYPVPLTELLRRAALEVVDPSAGLARPLVTGSRCEWEQRRVWRWLTFALPADLLLAAAGANGERFDVVSARLRNRLAADGLAEPHLHLKAAIGFPGLWASLMRALAAPTAGPDMLASPGAEWDQGKGLAPLLVVCALARLLLAGFLTDPSAHGLDFRQFLDQRAGPGLHRRFGATACFPLWRALIGLAAGRTPQKSDFSALRWLYAELIGPPGRGRGSLGLDPVGCRFAASTEHHPEFGLMRAALDYLEGPGTEDALFAKVFWQVQRGRLAFYRHVVQRPMVSGLQWFSRTYSRLSVPRRPVGLGDFVRQAADLAGPGLRSLEVRVTPEDRLADLRQLVEEVDRAAVGLSSTPRAGVQSGGGAAPMLRADGAERSRGSTPAPVVGLVFHFSRSRGGPAEEGRPAAWSRGGHADPADGKVNPSGYRYSGYYREQRTGAMALAGLLDAYPRMLERVRGVDLCTDELAIPLWVVRPLVQHVVRAGERAAARLHRLDGRLAPGPLRVTVHAGEDFVHLLGGIRRVDEAVERLGLGEGSRIGHAVALGVDVRDWAARTGRLYLPRGQRLLDLLWARRVVRRIPADLASWLPWIDRELVRLGCELFGTRVPAELIERWWDALYDPLFLRAAGFPDGPHPRSGYGSEADGEASSLGLIFRWLTDRRLFERMQHPEPIELASEVPLVVALQAHVRGILGTRGIAVEINPSSNLLIGNLGDLGAHPLWRLCPPPGIPSDAPSVRVCIGSDDPITFATSLPEEYQLLADALTGAGIAGPDVDAWLDAARQCGLTTRFTVSRSERALTTSMYSSTVVFP